MKQEYELIQSNTGKLLLVWFGGFALVMVMAIKTSDWLLVDASKNLHLAWFMVVILGGMFLLYRIGKAVSAVPMLVTVAQDHLTIAKPKSGEETRVPFAQIVAYRASSFNGAETLRLTLKDERKLQVKINSRLYEGQDFSGMVAAFEAAVGNFQQLAGPAVVVRRERNFFEKPLSTLLLGLLTAGLAWAVWAIVSKALPVKGNMFALLSSYLAYFAAWYAARERRNQPAAQAEAARGAGPAASAA
jgi:hypothetical protein